MSFYPVIRLEIGKRATRVYLQTRTSPYKPEDSEKIRQFVERVFEENRATLDHGVKNVILIWGDGSDAMADWWIWGEVESESEGVGIEVYLFRNNSQYQSPYVTAEDGLKILASEVETR